MRKADNLPPSCAVVTKSGNLISLETSGPLRACNGTAFPYAVGPSNSNEYLFGKRLVVLIRNSRVIWNLTSLSKSADGRISRNVWVSLSEQDMITTSAVLYEEGVAKRPWFPLYLTTNTIHNRQISMPPAEFEPAIPASEWPQTHALDQCFWTSVRPRPGAFFFHKTRARSQQIHPQNSFIFLRLFFLYCFIWFEFFFCFANNARM